MISYRDIFRKIEQRVTGRTTQVNRPEETKMVYFDTRDMDKIEVESPPESVVPTRVMPTDTTPAGDNQQEEAISNIFEGSSEDLDKTLVSPAVSVAAKPVSDEEIDNIFSSDESVSESVAEPEIVLPEASAEDLREATDAEIDDIFSNEDTGIKPDESESIEVKTVTQSVKEIKVDTDVGRPATESEIDNIFSDDDIAPAITEDPAEEEEIDDIFGESESPPVEEAERLATESEIDDIFGDPEEPQGENTANSEEIDSIFAETDDSDESIEKNPSKSETNTENNVNLPDPQEETESATVVESVTSTGASEEEIDALFGDASSISETSEEIPAEAESDPKKKS